MTRHQWIGLGSAVVTAGLLAIAPATAQDRAAVEMDIQKTLGGVPDFFKEFPDAGLAGAWAEMKGLQFNPKTELSGKAKELIGLAVAAQIPCTYCIYLHTKAAKAAGASDGEVREAIAMAAITRHWSTVLNGSQTDLVAFKKGVDALIKDPSPRADATGIDVKEIMKEMQELKK